MGVEAGTSSSAHMFCVNWESGGGRCEGELDAC